MRKNPSLDRCTISNKMRARRFVFRRRIELLVGDLEQLPLVDGDPDVVTLTRAALWRACVAYLEQRADWIGSLCQQTEWPRIIGPSITGPYTIPGLLRLIVRDGEDPDAAETICREARGVHRWADTARLETPEALLDLEAASVGMFMVPKGQGETSNYDDLHYELVCIASRLWPHLYGQRIELPQSWDAPRWGMAFGVLHSLYLYAHRLWLDTEAGDARRYLAAHILIVAPHVLRVDSEVRTNWKHWLEQHESKYKRAFTEDGWPDLSGRPRVLRPDSEKPTPRDLDAVIDEITASNLGPDLEPIRRAAAGRDTEGLVRALRDCRLAETVPTREATPPQVEADEHKQTPQTYYQRAIAFLPQVVESGMTLQAIAEELGCSHSTISRGRFRPMYDAAMRTHAEDPKRTFRGHQRVDLGGSV